MSGEDEASIINHAAVLVDQLKHDDANIRVNAYQHLDKIASALGPARTRDELIPFITNSIDDEEEVLFSIAGKLSDLVSYVGGAQYVHLLLEPLELLAIVEDHSVRDAVVKSLETVLADIPHEHLVVHFIPLLKRLATKDWFTAKISAASMCHLSYKSLSPSRQQEVRQIFIGLCGDDVPMVRRVAAQNLAKVVSVISLAEIQTEMLAPFTKLANDEQDSVRVQITNSCIVLAGLVPLELKISRILPVVMSIASDRSWRVRWSIGNCLHDVCSAFGPPITNDSLVAICETLISDNEVEVRSATAAVLPACSKTMKKDVVLQRIIPILQRLVSDSSDLVRSSIASVIDQMAVVLGKDSTIQHLLPLLLLLLRDENPEVRLHVISSLGAMNEVIGIELLSQSLLPAIIDLSEDSKWRIRVAVIGYIPMLAEKLGALFFNEKLYGLCISWLSDSVCTVRREAAMNLKKLVKLFGDEWSRDYVIPRIERIHVDKSYLNRITALYCIQIIAEFSSKDTMETVLLPTVLQMAADSVPNVRFTVSKTLGILMPHIQSSSALSEAMSTLSNLCSDSDRDVSFFSREVISAIENGSRAK